MPQILGSQIEEILSDKQRTKEKKSQDLITLLKDITFLDLNNKLKSIDDLNPLAIALKANCSINSLNLGDNDLNGQRLKPILEALSYNKFIRIVDLKKNGILLQDIGILKLYIEKCHSPFIRLLLSEDEAIGTLSAKAIQYIYNICDNRKKLWEKTVDRLIKETDIFIKEFKFSQREKNTKLATLKEAYSFIAYWQTCQADSKELVSLVYNVTKIFLLSNKTSHAMKLLYEFLRQNVGGKSAELLAPEFFSLILSSKNEDIKDSLQYILATWLTLLRCLQKLDTEKQQQWCERFYNHYAGSEPRKDITFIAMGEVKSRVENDGTLRDFVKSLQDISSEKGITLFGAPTREQREFLQYYESLKMAIAKNDLDRIYDLSINSEGNTQPLFKKIMRDYKEENQLIIIETLPIIFKKMIASEKLTNIGDQKQEKPLSPSHIEKGLFKRKYEETEGENRAFQKKKTDEEPKKLEI